MARFHSGCNSFQESNFERKFRQQGKTIYRMAFEVNPQAAEGTDQNVAGW
jgi:hypothetical protein